MHYMMNDNQFHPNVFSWLQICSEVSQFGLSISLTQGSANFEDIFVIVECLQESSDLLSLAVKFDSTALHGTSIVDALIPTLRALFWLMQIKPNPSSRPHRIGLSFIRAIMLRLSSAFESYAWINKSSDLHDFWTSKLSDFHEMSLRAFQICHTDMIGASAKDVKLVHACAAHALLLRKEGVIYLYWPICLFKGNSIIYSLQL